MPINVSLEDCYREAVMALGESLVRERLLAARLTELEQSDSAPETPAKDD